MNSDSRVHVRWTVLVAAALALLAAGAGSTYFWLRSASAAHPGLDPRTVTAEASASGSGVSGRPSSAPDAAVWPDIIVPLGKDAADRAGIASVAVVTATSAGGLRAPGVVEANGYKQIAVTSLVSGRVTRVSADLGQHVQPGQILAEILSPELAESQTRYISARAELDAHERELDRTEKLVEIGAASRQELERLHGEHTARRAEVESAALRLQLLGLSADAIDALGPGKEQGATMRIAAPAAGVVTERMANAGLNVDPTTKLFTILDLSSVWVVVNLYEKDFAHVRVGGPATITTTAYPNLRLQGRISFIDSQVSAETRTARVRVEVPNPRGELRLGMYAEALLGDENSAAMLVIPRSAVQNVGDRTVVYLVNPKEAGTFIEREVQLGAAMGDRVFVLSGVQSGDRVVADGSFYVRAERERLGLRPSANAGEQRGAPSEPASRDKTVREVRVTVTDTGFDPPRVTVRAGVPARLVFTRTSQTTCATAVVFTSLNVRRELPLNQPVPIEFTPDKPGEIPFVCGVNMLRGTVVVE